MILVSYERVRECYGNFKSISENFSIDDKEFGQIFKLEESIVSELFKIWDDTESGIVDALDLFSGVVIFSKATLQEKVRCKSLDYKSCSTFSISTAKACSHSLIFISCF